LALFLSLLFNVILTAEKWRLILDGLGYSLKFRVLFYVKLATDSIIAVAPLRSGELARPWYLSRRHGVPFTLGGASIVLELGLNFIALVLLALAGWIGLASGSIAAGVIAAALASVALVATVAPGGRLLTRILRLQAEDPESFRGRISEFIKTLWALPKKRLATVLAYSLLFELGEIINVALIFKAFSVEVSFIRLLAFVPAVALLGRLPISLSGLGVRESSLILAFRGFVETIQGQLLGIGLVYTFIESLFPILLGVPLTLHFLTTFPGKRKKP